VGHKTHPLGFRLGITQQHHSQWYTSLNNYSSLIQEDFIIRNEVIQFLQKIIKEEQNKEISVSKLFLQRNQILRKKKKTPWKNEIKLEIYSPTPAEIVGKKGERLKELYERLNKQLSNKIILINIIEIKNPYSQASLIADNLVNQLEARIPFRRAMKKIIDTAVEKNTEKIGIKVQVGGRLNGAEIARTEWRREGRVPLQTLRAKIDYSSKTAATIYGSLGIKIWLFKGEELNNSIFI
jgi:small subunit ribosomal protein S3